MLNIWSKKWRPMLFPSKIFHAWGTSSPKRYPIRVLRLGTYDRHDYCHLLLPKNWIYNCPICDVVFDTNQYLNSHISSVHKDSKPSCSVCDFNLAYQRSVDQHVMEVHDSRPYEQSIYTLTYQVFVKETTCPKSLTTELNLKLHNEAIPIRTLRSLWIF